MKKRFLSLLMATAVVLTTTTSPVFAAEEDVQDSSAAAISASGLCEHHSQHTAECGYVPAAEGASCTFVCEICNSVEGGDEETNVCICTELCIEGSSNPDCPVCNAKEADLATCLGKPEGATTVESWRFVENTDGLVVTEESGSYYVQPSPGETGIPLEELTALLPQAVEAQMDGAAVTVAITGWSCEDYIPTTEDETEATLWPTVGEYIFIATVEEGYAFDAAPEITVRLRASNAMVALAASLSSSEEYYKH